MKIRKFNVYCPDTKSHHIFTEGQVGEFLELHPNLIINGSVEVEEITTPVFKFPSRLDLDSFSLAPSGSHRMMASGCCDLDDIQFIAPGCYLDSTQPIMITGIDPRYADLPIAEFPLDYFNFDLPYGT